jgi:SsrA-binding protein
MLFAVAWWLRPPLLHFVYRCNFFYFCRQKVNIMAAKEMNNRAAYHDYFIEDKWTAGIMLLGTEVKSIREGKVSFNDSFCLLHKNELWVRGLYIAEYSLGTSNNHVAVHDRKLLLTKRELRKIENSMKDKGYTLVPLRVFFNDKHLAKVEIGLARGKKVYDKRETLKTKEAKREMDRATVSRRKKGD